MPRPSHMCQQSLVWCFCDINTGREVNFCHTWSEIWMHTKVFVDIHLYADEEVVLTARINRIKCTHTYKCYTAESINLLWNIPLSNESSAAMNLFIKWNFCSSSCKINLHSRWTRMSRVWHSHALEKLAQAAHAPMVRTRDILGWQENVCCFRSCSCRFPLPCLCTY